MESNNDEKETLDGVRSLLEEDDIILPENDTPPSKQEDQPPRMETERNTTFDSSSNSQEAVLGWAFEAPDIGKVTVTDTEKALYLKSVLNDVAVMFNIGLDMGDSNKKISADIRTLNNYEQDLAFLALEKDREENILVSPAALATRLQYYAGAMQLVSINGKRRANALGFDGDGSTLEADVDHLRDHVNTFIKKINWPRWQAILVCLRVFEAKVKICNDAALNGNFWKPRGADS